MSSRASSSAGFTPATSTSTDEYVPEHDMNISNQPSGSSTSSHRRPRTQITAVACQPCQQRKSKCDGTRPICSSCAAKGRTDCWYNAAGDQRRIESLKQRVRELESETEELRELLAAANARSAGGGTPMNPDLHQPPWQRSQRSSHSPLPQEPLQGLHPHSGGSVGIRSRSNTDSNISLHSAGSSVHLPIGGTTMEQQPAYIASTNGLSTQWYQGDYLMPQTSAYADPQMPPTLPIAENWSWYNPPGDDEWTYNPNNPHGHSR